MVKLDVVMLLTELDEGFCRPGKAGSKNLQRRLRWREDGEDSRYYERPFRVGVQEGVRIMVKGILLMLMVSLALFHVLGEICAILRAIVLAVRV